MRYLFLGAVAALFHSPGALASPETCAQISSDLDRLACYDKTSGRTPEQQILPATSSWNARKETSALTDQTTVILTSQSEEPVNCGWNRGDKITLVVRCFEKTTSVILQTGCHMASSDYNDYGHVTYRLDAEKARTAKMVESTDNRSLGLWNGGQSIPVIKQMFGKSKMIVRMTPYGQNPFTATFNISGLEEAAKPLREACSW